MRQAIDALGVVPTVKPGERFGHLGKIGQGQLRKVERVDVERAVAVIVDEEDA
jgi:hypothetical protein